MSSWSLALLKAGDQAAWREAYQDLWPIAWGIISRRVFSQASAEDLAQESLALVAEKINTFNDERHIRVMTGIVARSKAAHYLRDQVAGKRDRRKEVGLEAASEIAFIESETNAALDLEVMLRRLDPVDRQLLHERYVDGYNSEEIGRKHDLSSVAVRGRLKRALDILKAESTVATETVAKVLAALLGLSSTLGRFVQQESWQ